MAKNQKKERVQKIAICILLVLTFLFMYLTCYFALNRKTVVMNFRTPNIDVGATKIPVGVSRLAPTAPDPNGGTCSVTYSDQVKIDTSAGVATLMFQNPNGSGSDMVLHLCIGETEVAVSGLLKEGYEIESLPLSDEVQIEAGEYEGSFCVDLFNPKTGEKYMFALSAEATVSVK